MSLNFNTMMYIISWTINSTRLVAVKVDEKRSPKLIAVNEFEFEMKKQKTK